MDNINFQHWIQQLKNKQKPVMYIGGALIAIVGIVYYVSQIYLPSQEVEAQEAMYMAQLNFENKNFATALNGDAKFKGFNYIKDNFSFTKTKSVAKLYAGLCQLNLGKYDLAIEDLKGYSSDVDELQAVAYSAVGDAYAEKNNLNEAVSYYEKAAKASQNSTLAPRIGLKAAKAFEVKKDYKKARELYQFIKTEYPNSQEAGMIDIHLTRLDNLDK